MTTVYTYVLNDGPRTVRSPTVGAFHCCSPRRTVTGMILAAGVVGKKHHSAFHRVFAAARGLPDRVGLVLFDRLSAWPGDRGRVVSLAVDDTLARKRG